MTVDEIRPLTALRLLTLRQETRASAADELEAAAQCNAAVLAECCYCAGERAFPDAQAVLAELTFPQMETLLRVLAGRDRQQGTPAAVNPQFDGALFAARRGETA